MSISIESKDIWRAYTSDKNDLHPFFAILGVTREYMKIVRNIFKQGRMIGGLDRKSRALW